MKKTIINIASLFVSVVANRIFPILLFPILARTLGPDGFGHYVQAVALSYFLAQITEWGFNMTGVRQVALAAADRVLVGHIVSTIALSRALIACAIVALSLLLSPWLLHFAGSELLLGSAVAYGIAYAFDFRFAFYGLQQTRPLLILTFIQYLASFLAIMLLVREPSHAWRALAIPTAFSVVAAVISASILNRWAAFKRPRFRDALEEIRGSIQVFLARNVFQASSQLGVMALGLFASPAVVGWLGVSERIARTVGQLVLYPVQVGVTPVVLENSRTDQRQALIIYGASFAAACACAALAGSVMFFNAPLVLTIMLGSAPEGAIQVLKLLSFYPVIFVFIHQGGIFWLYLLHWDRENLTILMSYTLLFALMLILLSYQWQLLGVVAGILGAGIALVLAYAIFFAYKGIGPWIRPTGKALDSRRIKIAAVPA